MHIEALFRKVTLDFKRTGIIDLAASAAISGITTTLILTRLFLAKREIEQLLDGAGEAGLYKSTLPYKRVVMLVLESALPLTLLGVVGAILEASFYGSDTDTAVRMYSDQIMFTLWDNGLVSRPLLDLLLLSLTTLDESGARSPAYHI